MIGKIISHYKIIEEIGRGGMGVVYKAKDLTLDRFVALKFLPPSLNPDKNIKKNFIYEAKAASSIDHPNVCTIYEVGETDNNQLFITMAYYEGKTLRTLLKDKEVDVNMAVGIALQIARGLNSAHKKGIVHRDIKPENILITNDGVVKILDFGVAKFISLSTATNSSSTSGTIAYMSPEQARGSEIDFRTDIWSFGIIFYEMITGKIPFFAEYEQAIIYNILNEEPKKIDNTYGEKAKELNPLILKCLEKNKEKRPSSFKEIIDQLAARKPQNILYPFLGKIKTEKILVFSFFIILISALIIWIYSYYNTEEAVMAKQNWRIAVLPFLNNTAGTDSVDLPLMIQSLIVQKLTGITELAIIDPLSLNSYMKNVFTDTASKNYEKFNRMIKDMPVTYLIDGIIRKSDKGYLIQCILFDSKTLTILFSKNIYYDNYNVLPAAVDKLVGELLNYFQVKRMLTDKDIMPWIRSGCRNMGAIKAFLQGSKYNFIGEKKIAEKYFKKSIQLDSNFISPRIFIVSSLTSQKKLNEIDKHIKKLRMLEPQATPFEQAMIEWVISYAKNNVSDQIKHLNIALQYSPNNNMLLFNLARAYYVKGEYEFCIETIKKTVKQKWQYSPAYYLLGAAYERNNELSKSKKVLIESLSIEPVFHEIYALLARIYLIQEDSISAQRYEKKYIRRIKEMNSPLANTFSYLAQQNYLLGFNKKAKKYFHMAISENQYNPVFHQQLAEIFYDLGQTDSAIIEYKQSLKLDSTRIGIYYSLGKVYEKNDDTVNAKSFYNYYLQKDSVSNLAKEVKKNKAFLSN